MKLSLTQHTPGGWRIGDAGRTIFGPKTEDPVAIVIASLPPVSPRVTAEARKANARLIAATPELLEACKALRAVIVDHNIRKQNAGLASSMIGGLALHEADEAIYKAGGAS